MLEASVLLPGYTRRFAGPMHRQQPQRAGTAGDRPSIVQHPPRRALFRANLCRQHLHALAALLASYLEEGARPGRESAHAALQRPGVLAPVAVSLGLVDLLRVGDALEIGRAHV